MLFSSASRQERAATPHQSVARAFRRGRVMGALPQRFESVWERRIGGGFQRLSVLAGMSSRGVCNPLVNMGVTRRLDHLLDHRTNSEGLPLLVSLRKCLYLIELGGAEGGTRTPTVLLPPAPQAGASANSATSARERTRRLDYRAGAGCAGAAGASVCGAAAGAEEVGVAVAGTAGAGVAVGSTAA